MERILSAGTVILIFKDFRYFSYKPYFWDLPTRPTCLEFKQWIYFYCIRNEDQSIILQHLYLNYLPVTVSSNMVKFRLRSALTFIWIYGMVIREILSQFVQRNRIVVKIILNYVLINSSSKKFKDLTLFVICFL